MQNKNFYREFNKPIKENHYEEVLGGIMIAIVIVTFSLLSYGFWEALFEILSLQEASMKLSKSTQDKIWALTDVITSQYETRKKTSWKQKQEKN